ncbi:MAG: hypothetical protein J4431_03725 [Candidatus Aenigmarchaeota archaeon]|nr:hypothetical protein [Candidatus Aenigmarchaeota archaeon]
MGIAYLGFNDALSPHAQMAADEAMLVCQPALRFYGYKDTAVILGRNQHPSIVSDDAYPLARRITGGTATLEKPGDVRWAYSFPSESSLREMNRHVCGLLTQSLQNAGIPGAYADPETSTVKLDGKIIGGHARCIKNGMAFAHGIIAVTPYSPLQVGRAIRMRPGEEQLMQNMPDLSLAMGAAPQEAAATIRASMLETVSGGRYDMACLAELMSTPEYRQALKKHESPAWIKNGSPLPALPDSDVLVVDEDGITQLLTKTGHCFYSMYKDSEVAALQ